MTKTILPLASQMHRTFDTWLEGETEVMLCDCHGYRLERIRIDGKPSEWVRVRVTQ